MADGQAAMTEKNLGETLRLEQVVDLRDKAEKIGKFLLGQLKDYLETLRPWLPPVRVFGKHTKGSVWEDVPGAEIALEKLGEKFNAICSKPFSLPPDLAENAVADLDSRLELYPWEYTHGARDGNELKPVTVTSPVKNVLTYKSSYSLSQIRLALAGKDRRQDDVREFLVVALAMQSVWDRFPGIARLLKDLRYESTSRNLPD